MGGCCDLATAESGTMTNEQFDAECVSRRIEATRLLRSAKINGDVKNRHKFCAALGISTAIYNSCVDKDCPQLIYHAETANKILRNWHRLADIKRDAVKDAPDFESMAKQAAQGAGKI